MHTENVAPQDLLAEEKAHIVRDIQDALGDWTAFGKLIERQRPEPVRKRLSPNCLFWGLSTDAIIHHAATSRLVGLRKRITKQEKGFDWEAEVAAWTEQAAAGPWKLDQALLAMAWSHALPLLVSRLTCESWVDVLASLIAHQRQVGRTSGSVERFIVGSELPMALAYSLRPMSLCHALKDASRGFFEESMDKMLDGEGMPHATALARIQPFLASCTRTLVFDAEVKKGRIGKSARRQFDWLVRQCLRWARADGTTIFTTAQDAPFFDELMAHATERAGDQSDAAAHRRLRGKRKTSKADTYPDCSEHSEWSEVATLRTSWDPPAPRLAVDFSRPDVKIEIGYGRHTLLSGPFTPWLSIDGCPATPESAWEEVCWDSDDDMDYLEIECTLPNAWRMQRQFFLAREDKIAFLADAVLGPRTAQLEYRSAYPLVPELTMEQSDEANEASLLNSSRRATLIPLSLPEWQMESRVERLRSDPARLDVTRSGRALYVPIVFDLNPSRLRKALTWRKLTVAENLQALPVDSAAAYRLQIGKQQWVFYRSLDRPANRTFLGLNLMSEFLAARFHTDGEIETLVDIAG